jgi:hypothetical protein
MTHAHLRDIGIALYHHVAANGGPDFGPLPAAVIRDVNGQPLLSWRVSLLPYLGEEALYEQFKLDEPWDSPDNLKLLPRMPKVYTIRDHKKWASTDHTFFQVLIGPGTAFEGPKGVQLPDDFTDGVSKTILVAEAATAVPWTKPEELSFAPDDELPPLGGHFPDGFYVLVGDGSVHFVGKSVSRETIRAAITRNGGDIVGPDW